MARVVWLELSIQGSHGMAAHEYERMLAMVADGTLRPDLLVTDVIGLDDAPDALAAMTGPTVPGTRVIVP
jgi:alcohol dehydrogenase